MSATAASAASFRAAARELLDSPVLNGFTEIAAEAPVELVDGGAWVIARMFVSDEERRGLAPAGADA